MKLQYTACLSLFVFVLTIKSAAQKLVITKLGSTSLYESLYDVVQLSDSICYAVGEFGSRAKISLNTNACIYSTDSNKKTIVELINGWGINAEPFKVENDSTRIQYANYFYKGEQYSACFNAKIILPKAVIPKTKIYKHDKFSQKLLRKMYGSVVWQFYKQRGDLFAIKYNLFGTKVFSVNNKAQKSKRSKYLLHKSFATDSRLVLCGANNFALRHGIITDGNKTYKFKHQGMIWDVALLGDAIIAAGSRGKLYVKYKTLEKFEIIETGEPFHFYDLCICSPNVALAVGQGGIVYRIDLVY
jgi:hypothetical protein